jgi:hypothetical protein
MRALAVVEPESDFEAWVADQKPIPEGNPGTGAAAGDATDGIEGS